MANPLALTRTTVGRKVLMAASGIVLLAFVVVHMLGNLKIYQGPAKFDAYAEFLREAGHPVLGHGQLLWIARIVLFACLAVHVDAAVRLWLRNRVARDVGYTRFADLSFSRASRTMVWGGVAILAFVVYHLLHLTWGSAHPDFDPGSPYRNVVAGFRVWPVSLAYVAAMIPLGLHVYHGLWSTTQTLGVQEPRVLRHRRRAALLVAGAIVLGNVSIPLAVLLGWLE